MLWQRLSTDFWVWDLAARSNVSTRCLAREQRFSEYPPPLGLAVRLLINGPRGVCRAMAEDVFGRLGMGFRCSQRLHHTLSCMARS